MRRPTQRVTVPMIRRMAQLRRAGLSQAAIAAVINCDYGTELGAAGVRYRLSSYPEFANQRAVGQVSRDSGSNLGEHLNEARS